MKLPPAVKRCPKCGNASGDDWSQCKKNCPILFSPFFNKKTHLKYVEKAE